MKKILVADDEQAIREMVKEKLEQHKFSVITAADGQEAFIVCENHLPDLVLLDIAMPVMDGYAACEKIKKDPRTKNIPVLFLTGKELEPDGIMQRCQDLFADGHVSKTASLEELVKKIVEVIGAA